MGYEKHKRPMTAPSFTPNPTGIALADLAQGTNGQIPVAQTSGATTYRALSGDITVNSTGVTAVGAKKVTAAKAAVFYADAQTGSGSGQAIAHGLAADPSVVLVIPTDGGTATYTHDSTNVTVTCTNAKKYAVLAWV